MRCCGAGGSRRGSSRGPGTLRGFGAAVVADEESLELVEPGEGALDDPAVAAEPGAVLAVAPCDLRSDAAPAELAAIRGIVVGAVAGDPVGP